MLFIVDYLYENYSCDTTQSWGTTDGQRLTNTQQTLTSLSIITKPLPVLPVTSVMGIVPFKLVNFCFRTPITRSTNIQTRDNSLLQSTSTFSSCFFPLMNGGCLTSAKAMPVYSSHVKPLSARITSPVYREVFFYVIDLGTYRCRCTRKVVDQS